ncbi:MAG TPA: hypothetical protein VHC50_07440 [Puia sp.]|nr:hypothetical protein [Puia sp.]
MKKTLHRILFYTLLFGVYGIFFSVECLYNFDSQGNTRNIVRYVRQVTSHEKDADFPQTAPLHSASNHSIRLNKHFHEEDIPPCPVLSPVRPEYVLAPLIMGSFCRTDLAKPPLLHRSLRGPPTLV